MGILDEKLGQTSVTIGDVQKFLLDYAELKEGDAKIVEQSNVRIGVGMGFISHIMKISLKWDHPNPKLPEHLVVKVPTIESMEKVMDKMSKEGDMDSSNMQEQMAAMVPMIHKTECTFYEEFRHNSPVPIAHIYYTEEISKTSPGIIAMEDFTQSNGVNVDLATGYRLNQIFHLVECLADLQTYSYKNREWIDKFPMPDLSQFKDFSKMLGVMMDTCKKINPHFTQDKMDVVKPFVEFDNMLKSVEAMEKADFLLNLTHGDLWFNNLFFTKDEKFETSDDVLAIIDWQTCRKGQPVEDMCRMMVSSVDPHIRRRFGKTILHHFYDRVCSQMEEPPYSFDRLLSLYNNFFPLAMGMFAFGLPMMIGDESPMLAGKDPEYAKRARASMWARGEAALDDAVELIKSGKADINFDWS